jgi:hypothetical protein
MGIINNVFVTKRQTEIVLLVSYYLFINLSFEF